MLKRIVVAREFGQARLLQLACIWPILAMQWLDDHRVAAIQAAPATPTHAFILKVSVVRVHC